jgi:hypothetical protein
MPKSQYDTAAMLVVAASLILSTVLFKTARRHYTDAQRATLATRGMNEIVVASSFGSVIAYFIAPVQPALAVSAALACAILCGYGLLRHHAGQNYSRAARGLLVVGLSIQVVGTTVAVIVRAWS